MFLKFFSLLTTYYLCRLLFWCRVLLPKCQQQRRRDVTTTIVKEKPSAEPSCVKGAHGNQSPEHVGPPWYEPPTAYLRGCRWFLLSLLMTKKCLCWIWRSVANDMCSCWSPNTAYTGSLWSSPYIVNSRCSRPSTIPLHDYHHEHPICEEETRQDGRGSQRVVSSQIYYPSCLRRRVVTSEFILTKS